MDNSEKALATAVPRAALVLTAATVVYAAADLRTPHRTGYELPYYFLTLWIPLATYLNHRFRLVSPKANIIACDVCWTSLMALGLGFAPQATVSGSAFILGLKWMTTALLLPWGVGVQVFSCVLGLALYFGALLLSPHEGSLYVHQWALPPVAAVLSVVGCRLLEGSRQQAREHAALLARSERQLQGLVDLSPDGMVVTQNDRIAFANERLAQLLGRSKAADVIGTRLVDLVAPEHHEELRSFLRRAATASAPLPAILLDLIRADGSLVSVSLSAAPVSYRDGTGIQVTLRDMTAWQRNLLLLEGERRILEEIASGAGLPFPLASICTMIESLSPGTRSSVLLADNEAACLRPGAAPSLPASFTRTIDGLAIAEGNGTCGTAAARRQTVITENTAEDVLWEKYRPLAAQHGLASCWSTPILSSQGQLLGTFALYRSHAQRPTEEDLLLIHHAGHLASIAIQRHRLEQAQLNQAELFSTLADVGRSLISSLEESVLLGRICESTRRALHADVSHVYLLDEGTDSFVPSAMNGDSSEQWELVRAVSFPRLPLEPSVRQLESEESIEVSPTRNTGLLPPGSQAFLGIHSGLFVALRRDGHIIGILTVGYRQAREPFTAHQHRLVRGIAQLAALALQNSRLMQELDGANRVKANFVATMSHELRTPLNVLIGYQDLLLDEEFGPLNQDQQEILRRLGFHARQLLLLVNDTLDLSRLESGKMEVHREPVPLAPFVDRLLRETQETIGKRNLALHFTAAPDLVVHTDAAKLHVILRSLVTNAVKFTETGSVTVSAQRLDAGVEIVVADTGIGIPPGALDVIFEPFQQASPSISNRFGGAGLGLHIAKRLLDLLGGKISVTSTEGTGSTFHVRLPDAPRSAVPMARAGQTVAASPA